MKSCLDSACRASFTFAPMAIPGLRIFLLSAHSFFSFIFFFADRDDPDGEFARFVFEDVAGHVETLVESVG
jgi:hypothetical protein